MQDYDHKPNDAYILVRVFNVDDDTPGVEYFVNPWSLFLEGVLDMMERDDGDYSVRIVG